MIPRHSENGSLIISALLLFSLLLALGLGLMSSQAARMRAARAQVDALQAKSLALSAWADVKAKLGKDLFFPPQAGEVEHFSYSEDVYDDEAGEPVFVGTYTVIVDMRFVSFRRGSSSLDDDSLVNTGVGFYLVTCIGKVGERGAPPRAERTMQFELDAERFEVIRMHDWESL